MSRKRKIARDNFDEYVLESMRYVLLSTPMLEDIGPKLQAAFREMKELEVLKQNTPASERTPEWEADHKRRTTACFKKMDALTKRWEDFNASFDASETPTSRH